jgi:hypothetical protein
MNCRRPHNYTTRLLVLTTCSYAHSAPPPPPLLWTTLLSVQLYVPSHIFENCRMLHWYPTLPVQNNIFIFICLDDGCSSFYRNVFRYLSDYILSHSKYTSCLSKMSYDSRRHNIDKSLLYLLFLSMFPLLVFFVIKIPFNIIVPSTLRSSKWYLFRVHD